MARQRGIDISAWQGTVDFAKVKADGVQFVILHEGYSQAIDKKFLEYALSLIHISEPTRRDTQSRMPSSA